MLRAKICSAKGSNLKEDDSALWSVFILFFSLCSNPLNLSRLFRKMISVSQEQDGGGSSVVGIIKLNLVWWSLMRLSYRWSWLCLIIPSATWPDTHLQQRWAHSHTHSRGEHTHTESRGSVHSHTHRAEVNTIYSHKASRGRQTHTITEQRWALTHTHTESRGGHHILTHREQRWTHSHTNTEQSNCTLTHREQR